MEITDSHATVNRLETCRLRSRVQLSRSAHVTYTISIHIEDAYDIKVFIYVLRYCRVISLNISTYFKSLNACD